MHKLNQQQKPQDHQRSLLELYLLNNQLDFKDVLGTVTDLLLGGSDAVGY